MASEQKPEFAVIYGDLTKAKKSLRLGRNRKLPLLHLTFFALVFATIGTLLILFSRAAVSDFYYVDPGSIGGTCSNAYTESQAKTITTPWCSLDTAANKALADSTVYVRRAASGHHEYNATNYKIDSELRTSWVTFKPYPAEQSQVILDGVTRAVEIYNSNYIRFQSFEMNDGFFIDNTANYIEILDNHIYSEDQTRDVNTTNGEVANQVVTSRCTSTCAGQSNWLISGNRVENLYFQCLGVGSNTSACDGSDDAVFPGKLGYPFGFTFRNKNVTIKNNTIDGFTGDAIQAVTDFLTVENNIFRNQAIMPGSGEHADILQIFSPNMVTDLVFRNNRVYQYAHGFQIQNGPRQNFLIEGNVFADTSPSGALGSFDNVGNLTIRHNTFGDSSLCTDVGWDPAERADAPDGVLIYNNIFGECTETGGVKSLSVSNGITNAYVYNNIVEEPELDPVPACNGCVTGTANSPTYRSTSAGSEDYRLAIGSIGIDKGYCAKPFPQIDALGGLRPVDVPDIANANSCAVDIGAYEYQTSTTTTPPADTTAPVTSLTTPANGATLAGTVPLSANASDNVGVTKVEFYRGTTKLGEAATAPYSYSWNTTTVANGSYSLITKAYDTAGNVGTSTAVNVTVNNIAPAPSSDTTAPFVTISSPLDGSMVTNTLTIAAKATDNVEVTAIEVYLDNKLFAYSSSNSISTSWNTKPKSRKGPHTITVKAKDAAGNTGTKTVSVTAR